jgi:hypothetical protein
MEEIITFQFQNNTNGTIPISAFGDYTDPMDNANATTRYRWNLTGFSVTNENNIYIQYRGVNETSFSTAVVAFSGTSLQDVCNTLNTLNLGAFFVTTSGANTYIDNYNVNVVFGNLSVYSSLTTSASYSVIQSNAGGSGTIQVNAVTQVTYSTPSSASGSLSNVNVGSVITISGTGETLNTTELQVLQISNQTGVSTQIYFSATAPLAPFGTSFTAQAGYSYTIAIGEA